MKKWITLTILAAAPLLAAEGGALTESERSFLVETLEQSKKNMLSSIEGVIAAQWRFKPGPNVWSVAECAEHLILAEDFLFGNSQLILKSPAVPRPESSNAEVDRKIVAGVTDRSQKATAPEPIVPSGKFATPADAAREFTLRRDKSIAYAKTTTDDLRVHMTKSPLGNLDAYQFLLLMAAHTNRHTAQIREVQANAAYPKSAAKSQFILIYTLAKGTLDQMKGEQLDFLAQHGVYLTSQIQKGVVKWAGRTMNPANVKGFVELEVASEADAREYLKNDPAIKAGVLVATIDAFAEAPVR
jgi:uncharacterized protein YciI